MVLAGHLLGSLLYQLLLLSKNDSTLSLIVLETVQLQEYVLAMFRTPI